MNAEVPTSARVLLQLAGIQVPAERELSVAAGLEGTRRIAEALARRDYRNSEPAARFLPPRAVQHER